MCGLCNLDRKSTWYYEDDEFIICNCITCKIPMIVSKDHNRVIGTLDGLYLKGLVKGVFHGKNFSFRKEQRKVKDHWHWHIILED